MKEKNLNYFEYNADYPEFGIVANSETGSISNSDPIAGTKRDSQTSKSNCYEIGSKCSIKNGTCRMG